MTTRFIDSLRKWPMRHLNANVGLLTTLLLLVTISDVFAQSSAGTDFWMAQTPNSGCGSEFAVVVANPSATTASVQIANPVSATLNLSIPSGELRTRLYPCLPDLMSGNLGGDLVYHVTSNVDVVVYTFCPLEQVSTNDAALVLPVSALGQIYWVASYFNVNGNGHQDFIGVVAAQNGTTINLYDQQNVLRASATINRGQYWQKVAPSFPRQELTGWRVETSVPAAVFAGNVCTSAGNSISACDHIYEQLPPAETLADTYIASPTLSRPIGCSGSGCAEDIFRYVATVNGTTITTTPNVGGGTINAGQFIEILTDVPHIVSANNPILGMQILLSQDSGSPPAGTGDPAMLNMQTVDQFQFNYIFLTPSTYDFDFINVVKPVSGTIALDGNPISPPCTAVGSIAGTPYCSLRLQVTDGPHTIVGNQAFGLSVSSFHRIASYAYIGGGGLQPIHNGCDTGGPYSIMTATLTLAGTASCSNNSTPSTLWSSGDGVVFADPTDLNTSATMPASTGTFEVCLTVTCGNEPPVTCCSSVTVQAPGNSAPTCNAGTAIADACTSGTITGTTITDSDGSAVTYTWSSNSPNMTVSPNSGSLPAGPTGAQPLPTFSVTHSGLPCNQSATLTLTVTDALGASSTCTTSITFNDTTDPALIGVPDDQTVECDAVPDPAAPTAEDVCSAPVNLIYAQDADPGQCLDNYTLTRTWTATDACGNVTVDEQVITVVDTTAPLVTGVLTPTTPLPAGSAQSVCSARSTREFRVICEATDNCDDMPVLTGRLRAAQTVVGPNSECITVVHPPIDVYCDQLVEIQLLAPPCASDGPTSARPVTTVNSAGVLVVSGDSVVLEVTAEDRCGNAATDTFDPRSEPSPLCDEVLTDGTCCPAILAPPNDCADPCGPALVKTPTKQRESVLAGRKSRQPNKAEVGVNRG